MIAGTKMVATGTAAGHEAGDTEGGVAIASLERNAKPTLRSSGRLGAAASMNDLIELEQQLVQAERTLGGHKTRSWQPKLMEPHAATAHPAGEEARLPRPIVMKIINP